MAVRVRNFVRSRRVIRRPEAKIAEAMRIYAILDRADLDRAATSSVALHSFRDHFLFAPPSSLPFL